MSLVISDTSPIRALEWLGLLNLLETLHGKVFIPPAVADELTHTTLQLRRLEVSQYSFIQVTTPVSQIMIDRLRLELDRGESEAIALALEMAPCKILIDEAAGRRKSANLGLEVIGTIGILIQAKQHGLIPAIAPLLSRLRTELKFFLSENFVRQILDDVGEIE